MAYFEFSLPSFMQRIYYYYLGLFGFFGLFTLLMMWNSVLSSAQNRPTALLLLFIVGPLLLPFRGLLRQSLKSCTWMSYLSLPYFVHGIIEMYASNSPMAALEVLFSLLMCFGTGLYVYTAPKHKS